MKRTLLALAATLGLLVALAAPAHAIIGGTPDTTARPYMGSIQTTDGTHGCGATLITDRWALTAYHCVEQWRNNPAAIATTRIRFASPDHTTGGTLAHITAVHTPPDARLAGADIALLELAAPVDLPPAQLPTGTPPNGTTVTLIGWGLTCTQSVPPLYHCGTSPAQLHRVDVRVNPDWQCTSPIYGIHGPTELCLGDYLSGKTACYGDSGGPALLGDRIVGVTSRSGQVWLYGNCYLAPIVYTDVFVFLPWIRSTTGT